MNKALLCALTLLAMPAFADNQRGFYAGGGIASLMDEQDEVRLSLASPSVNVVSGNTSGVISGEVFGGYKYNGFLGGEIRLGSGFRAGEAKTYSIAPATITPTPGVAGPAAVAAGDTITTGDVEREIGTYGSLYYKPEIRNDEATLYALIGYSFMSTSKTVKTKEVVDSLGAVTTPAAETKYSSENYNGLSYGIGVGFVITDNVNINVEYRNLCEDLYSSPNMASMNFDYRF